MCLEPTPKGPFTRSDPKADLKEGLSGIFSDRPACELRDEEVDILAGLVSDFVSGFAVSDVGHHRVESEASASHRFLPTLCITINQALHSSYKPLEPRQGELAQTSKA